MLKLEAGQIYQVKDWKKNWILAEYVKEVAAHSYRYTNLNMNTCEVGPERTRHVPTTHLWQKIGFGSSFKFHTEAKGMEVRPASEESLATIARLKSEVERLSKEYEAARKELRNLCN